VLRGKSSGYQIRNTMNVRQGLARIAHDQAEHLITLAILVQNGLERGRITRLVIFGIGLESGRITRLVIFCIEFVSFLLVFGFDFS
jgi:hypothetical protein